MALQDILAAISAEADRQIAEARAANQNTISQIREKGEQAIAKKRQEIRAQKEQKLDQMRRKAEAYAETQLRNAQLRKKRDILDRVYTQVLEELAKLPDAKVESLLKSCVAQLRGKGEIRPTKKHAALLKKLASGDISIGESVDGEGGFVFVSAKQEQDFRFETLVQDVLRPRTELDTSRSLFSAA